MFPVQTVMIRNGLDDLGNLGNLDNEVMLLSMDDRAVSWLAGAPWSVTSLVKACNFLSYGPCRLLPKDVDPEEGRRGGLPP
jgi:hypothetical protein